MTYLIIIEKTKNNYSAYSPDVDGCVTTGKTIAETIKNMQEALDFHLEEEPTLPIPKELSYWLARLDQISSNSAQTLILQMNVGNEVIGTQNAFLKMISQRGISSQLEVDKSTVSNWKRYITSGKTVSKEKMEEMLIKAGWKTTSQQAWQQL